MIPIPNLHEVLYDNGQLRERYWTVDDIYHNLKGPACEKWNKDGSKDIEFWMVNGAYHRLDGPAKISWTGENSRSEEYFVNGIWHNTKGPAYVVGETSEKYGGIIVAAYYQVWVREGIDITNEVMDFVKAAKLPPLKKYETWSDEDKFLLKISIF